VALRRKRSGSIWKIDGVTSSVNLFANVTLDNIEFRPCARRPHSIGFNSLFAPTAFGMIHHSP
jgi:hypothetical protein